MAIRTWKGRRKPYQVYWCNPFTKKQESASFETMQEAKKAEARIKFRLTWEKDTFMPEEEIKEPVVDDSLETIDALYLQEKRPAYNVLKWHMSAMKLPLALFGRRRIGSINRQDLAHLLSVIQTKGLKGSTVSNKMKVVLTLLRWAMRRGYIDSVPQFPELPASRYEHFVPPTPEEASAIYSEAPDHVRRVIILGCRFGIRVGPSEMYKLRWDHVDLDRGVIRVQAARKNLEEPWREVPIKDSIRPLLLEWKEHDAEAGIQWVVSFRGKPLNGGVHKAFEKACRKAGINRHIRPYDLRHSFATDAIASGADVGTVARLMGHTNPTMTLKHYQHVMTAQKKSAVEALPDIKIPDMCFLTNDDNTRTESRKTLKTKDKSSRKIKGT